MILARIRFDSFVLQADTHSAIGSKSGSYKTLKPESLTGLDA